jgi:dethiobiotin synthase
VGKTLLSACLLAAFPRARYAKPVQTGWPEEDDAATVRALAEAAPGRVLEHGARLREPCSPHHAALLEDLHLSTTDLVRPLERADDGRPWVVEGAGGVLTPLSTTETMLDLARSLGLPVVVAAAVRLGSINATLLTLRALEASTLHVVGVVAMGAVDRSYRSALEAHARAPLLSSIAFLDPVTPADIRGVAATLAPVGSLAGALA